MLIVPAVFVESDFRVRDFRAVIGVPAVRSIAGNIGGRDRSRGHDKSAGQSGSKRYAGDCVGEHDVPF
jgi:hypothetical protein